MSLRNLLRPLAFSALLASAASAQGGGAVPNFGVGHQKGSAAARTHIMEFVDFGCSYCAKFAAETFVKIDSAYIKGGTVKWTLIPYVTGMFRNSREVTVAAECAAEQGKFWEMHDLLYAKQKEWKASRQISATVNSYVTQLKLDKAAFARCSMNPGIARRVDLQTRMAAQRGVRATPTFFVNGQMVEGAVPWADFKSYLDRVSR